MNSKDLINRVATIFNSPELLGKFRKVYGTDLIITRACINSNMIKRKAIQLIIKLTNPT